MTGTSPDWLAELTAMPLERLFVWAPPRPQHYERPPRRPDPRRTHARRYVRVLDSLARDRSAAPPRWRPLPDQPVQVWRCAAGEPGPDDYVMIRGVLRRRPGCWAVVYVGDRAGAGQVQALLRSGVGGVGGFDVIVRAAGDGLFQAHARFLPTPAR